MKNILYAKPSITDLEISYVNDAIRNGWGNKCYEYINRFQESFKDYLGSDFAIATSSCTGAIHLALAALGIEQNDEVIVPDITWIASVAPIVHLNAKPIFVDILENSWCIDPKKIEQAITAKTKAILVVHLYGNLVQMDEIIKISKKYSLPIIEDAAEALGSEYKGKKAGSLGDFGVFSFHGTKTMTTGEGGMLVTNRKDLIDRLDSLSNHGRKKNCDKFFWPEQIGYKYKMSNIQAALGLAQLERIDKLIDKKRQIFHWYKEAFEDFESIHYNPEQLNTKNSYWMPTFIFSKKLKINRDLLIAELIRNQIEARPFFYPLSSLPMFEQKFKNEVSYNIFNRGINLPSAFNLKKNHINHVKDNIIKIIKLS